MALEKMKLNCTYPLPYKIEEDRKDYIDQDTAGTTPEKIVLEWHAEIRKFFARNVNVTGEAKLINLMNCYIESLRERASHFEDTETLKLMMDKHLKHIYWMYTELDICYPDSYLDHMEHILTFYVNLWFRFILKLKNKRKITREMVINTAGVIVKRLSLYLLSSEYHIFHVLIRQSSSLAEDMVTDVIKIHNSYICKQLFRHIYIYYLVNQPTTDKSDEAFCRCFILFENWKVFDEHKTNEKIETLIQRKFGKGSECIKENTFLKKILVPEPSIMTQLMKVVGCDAGITKAYFDYIKSKQKESAAILDDIGKLAQDLGSSSDLDWDEDDEDSSYKTLYKKVVGPSVKRRSSSLSNSEHPHVKEEKIIEDEIHVINSDSDSDSVELVSIIPSGKNRYNNIRPNRKNNALDDEELSFLDSFAFDLDLGKENTTAASRLNFNKSTIIDRNQNESVNPSIQNVSVESKPEIVEKSQEQTDKNGNTRIDIQNKSAANEPEITQEQRDGNRRTSIDLQLDTSMQNLKVRGNSDSSSKNSSEICEKSSELSNVENERVVNVPTTEQVKDIIDLTDVVEITQTKEQSTSSDKEQSEVSKTIEMIIDVCDSPAVAADTEMPRSDKLQKPNTDISKDCNKKIVATIRTSMFRKSDSSNDFIDDLFRCDTSSVVNTVPRLATLSKSTETPTLETEIPEKTMEKIDENAMPCTPTMISEKVDENSGSNSEVIRVEFQESVQEIMDPSENVDSTTLEKVTENEALDNTQKSLDIPSEENAAVPSFLVEIVRNKDGVSENCSMAPELPPHSNLPEETMDVQSNQPNHLEDAMNPVDVVRITQINDQNEDDSEIEIPALNHLPREKISTKVRKKPLEKSKGCEFLDTGQSVSLQDTGQSNTCSPDLNVSNDEMVLDQTSAQNPIITTNQNVEECNKSQLSKDVQRIISPPGYLTPPGSDKEGDKNAEEFSSSIYTNITSEPFTNGSALCCVDQGETSAIVETAELNVTDENRIGKKSSLAEKYEQIVADSVNGLDSAEDELDDCGMILNADTDDGQPQPVDMCDDMEQFLRNYPHDDTISLQLSKNRISLSNGKFSCDNDSSNKPAPVKKTTRTVRINPEVITFEVPTQPDADSLIATNRERKYRASKEKSDTDVMNKSTSVYNNHPKNGQNIHQPPLSNNLIIKREPLKGIVKNTKGNPSYHPQHSLNDDIGYIVINVDQQGGKRVKISRKTFNEYKVRTDDPKLRIGPSISMNRLSPNVISVWQKITQRTRGDVIKELSFSPLNDDKPMYKIVFDKRTPELNKNDLKYYHEPSNAEHGLGINLENKFEAGTVNASFDIVCDKFADFTPVNPPLITPDSNSTPSVVPPVNPSVITPDTSSNSCSSVNPPIIRYQDIERELEVMDPDNINTDIITANDPCDSIDLQSDSEDLLDNNALDNIFLSPSSSLMYELEDEILNANDTENLDSASFPKIRKIGSLSDNEELLLNLHSDEQLLIEVCQELESRGDQSENSTADNVPVDPNEFLEVRLSESSQFSSSAFLESPAVSFQSNILPGTFVADSLKTASTATEPKKREPKKRPSQELSVNSDLSNWRDNLLVPPVTYSNDLLQSNRHPVGVDVYQNAQLDFQLYQNARPYHRDNRLGQPLIQTSAASTASFPNVPKQSLMVNLPIPSESLRALSQRKSNFRRNSTNAVPPSTQMNLMAANAISSNRMNMAPTTQTNIVPSQMNMVPTSHMNLAPTSQMNLVPTSQMNLAQTTHMNLVPTSRMNLVPTTHMNLVTPTQMSLTSATQMNLVPTTQMSLASATQMNLVQTTQMSLAPTTQISLVQTNLVPTSQMNLVSTSQMNLVPSTRMNLIPPNQVSLPPVTQMSLVQTNMLPTTQMNLSSTSQINLEPTTQMNIVPLNTSFYTLPTSLQSVPSYQPEISHDIKIPHVYQPKVPIKRKAPTGKRRGRPPKRAKKTDEPVAANNGYPQPIYAAPPDFNAKKNITEAKISDKPGKTAPQPMPVPITFNFETDTLKKEVYNSSKIECQSNENDAEFETHLPLKKRKLSMPVPVAESKTAAVPSSSTSVGSMDVVPCSSRTSDKGESTKEISYPATPMLSIAEVYSIPMVQRQFKTPAEKKQLPQTSPPIPPHYDPPPPNPVPFIDMNTFTSAFRHLNTFPFKLDCPPYVPRPSVLFPSEPFSN